MRILSLLIFLLNPECHTFVFQSTLQILPGALVHSSLRVDREREREREKETEGASDYRVRVIYREIQRKKYSVILTDIEDSNVCNIHAFI